MYEKIRSYDSSIVCGKSFNAFLMRMTSRQRRRMSSWHTAQRNMPLAPSDSFTRISSRSLSGQDEKPGVDLILAVIKVLISASTYGFDIEMGSAMGSMTRLMSSYSLLVTNNWIFAKAGSVASFRIAARRFSRVLLSSTASMVTKTALGGPGAAGGRGGGAGRGGGRPGRET